MCWIIADGLRSGFVVVPYRIVQTAGAAITYSAGHVAFVAERNKHEKIPAIFLINLRLAPQITGYITKNQ